MEKKTSFAALDFEHLTPRHHTACAVGLVIVRENIIVQEHYSLIRPPEDGEQLNTHVHGITPEMCKDAPIFPEVWEVLSSLIGRLPVVAHRHETERDCIECSCRHYGMGAGNYALLEYIDTYTLTGKSLADSCEHYGIPLAEHHNALEDARACALLYMKLNGSELIEPKPKKKTPYINADRLAQRKQERSNTGSGLYDAPVLQDVDHQDTPFFGKLVQVTGDFEYYEDRDVLKGVLKKLGATIEKSGSYVKRGDILVAGSGAGPSKLKKAEADGKRIINEKELYKILEGAGLL